MTEHWHIVTKDIHLECPGEFTYTWECPGPPHCTGFSECHEPHIENGINADHITPHDVLDGDDDVTVPPWDGIEEWTFHGVPHTYHDGYGWTVPYDGCVVEFADLEVEDALLNEPPGRYAIDVSWESPEEPYIDDVARVES